MAADRRGDKTHSSGPCDLALGLTHSAAEPTNSESRWKKENPPKMEVSENFS